MRRRFFDDEKNKREFRHLLMRGKFNQNYYDSIIKRRGLL
jgi:hypothetical protein